MLQFLDQLPFPVLIVVTVFMLLAPFHPTPHLVEKIILLKNGQLHRPIDLFDLLLHLAPLLLLALKWWLSHGRT